MKKNKKLEEQEIVCVTCGATFVTKIRNGKRMASSCPDCLSKNKSKTCSCCGETFYRDRMSIQIFVGTSMCHNCAGDPMNRKRPDNIARIYNNIVAESNNRSHVSKLSEEEHYHHISECCARLRLVQLYAMLEEHNDGTPLQDRLPHIQLYLKDILRRIKNLNELLRIEPERRLPGMWPSPEQKEEPTTRDLLSIEINIQ